MEDGAYYLFGTTDAEPWREGHSFLCYKTSDLEHYEGPFTAFAPGEDFAGVINFWAPEVHKHGGSFYMFASFLRPGCQRGTMVLKAARPEGPYIPVTGIPYTPGDWSCLDGTFFEEGGKLYSFFIPEWTQITDGTVELAQLKEDFSGMASQPVTLFHVPMPPGPRDLRVAASSPTAPLSGSWRAGGWPCSGPASVRKAILWASPILMAVSKAPGSRIRSPSSGPTAATA